MGWIGAEIQEKERIFYYQDESHLVWGDVCGYVWSRRGQRLRVPVINERIRQTYFGVLNVVSGKASIKRFSKANGVTTVDFLKFLLRKSQGKKIILCWDRVPYHRSAIVKEFVRKVNAGLARKEKRLILIALPINAPEENLMEEVWLSGKTSIRRSPKGLITFDLVKEKLERSIRAKKFKFNKLKKLQNILQLK